MKKISLYPLVESEEFVKKLETLGVETCDAYDLLKAFDIVSESEPLDLELEDVIAELSEGSEFMYARVYNVSKGIGFSVRLEKSAVKTLWRY